ncbi:hypothetical protein BJY01DRAFT_221376 [Aspergillus pseudoustus]|uniref:Protein ecm33 n=1 Tax=Aspergillus pseudoustus TaxID=1810923 RepID=A0ABR4JBP6_9EURO
MARQIVGLAALATAVLASTETSVQSIADACSNSNSLSIPISSQSDIYTLLNSGCTTLYGQLQIQGSFEGEFILPNVTTIKVDGITIEDGASSKLTAIELPDLVEVSNSIELGTLARVKKVSMPKLKSIPGNLSGTLLVNATKVEFGALEEVKKLDLVGNFTSLEFPSLQTVNETISICNVRECDMEYYLSESTMDISFPALKSADVFYIKGQASRIFAPNLSAIGMLPTVSGGGSTNVTSTTNATNTTSNTLEARDPFPGPQDVLQGLNLNFEHDSVPLHVSFPSLVNVTKSVNLKGPFQSLSFPSLTTYPENFTVESTQELYLNLPVVHATNLEFLGWIKALNMTNLVLPFDLTVYPESWLQCEDIIIPNYLGRIVAMSDVYCSTYEDPSTGYIVSHDENGLSTVQKVVIAVVVIVVVALGLVVGFVLWKRRKARQELKTGLVWRPESIYSYGRGSGSGSGSDSDEDGAFKEKVVDVVVERRGSSPPPYPARPQQGV